MAEVLYVSKPVAPPWNDSSKNLVRDLSAALECHQAVLMTRSGEQAGEGLGRAKSEAVYGERAGGFSPALRDNLSVLQRLLLGRRGDIWHFFFAPNPRTSAVGRVACRLRGVRSVQTVCSAPRAGQDLRRLLFADRTVVLSAHTERRMLEAGVEAHHLRRIPPAIGPLDPPTDEQRRAERRALGLPVDVALVVYPGDLEFGNGARHTVEALALLASADVHLVVACRLKTVQARQREHELRARVATLGITKRVTFVGETPRIHGLLGAADLVCLPSENLYAKMDYPLVLLEAMAMARPVLVATDTPAAELADGGAARAVTADPDAIAAEIDALLGAPAVAEVLAATGRRRVLEEFNREQMAKRYEALYDELLAG